jgi:O-antigen ligase
VFVAIGFAGYASYSVQQQLTADDRNTNSVGVREDVEAATRELWVESPLVGVGVRYYRTGDFPGYTASNNALNSEMAEAGIVGTSGFVLLHVVVLAGLWRRRSDPWAIAALALVAGNVLHGQFDIYWSSGITPLPFLVAGVALAAPRAPR